MSNKASVKRSQIETFISKYHLGGLIEKVIWKNDAKSLSTKFINDTRTLLGSVTWKGFSHESEFELGVFTTSKLSKLLGVLDEDITFSVHSDADIAKQISVSDGNTVANYQLSNLDVIPDGSAKPKLPAWDASITLTKEFIDRFIRGCLAMNEIGSFNIGVSKSSAAFVIGYSSMKSNTVSLEMPADVSRVVDKVTFPTATVKEIFSANKDMDDGVMHISSQGLSSFEFKCGDYKTIYFVVAMQEAQ